MVTDEGPSGVFCAPRLAAFTEAEWRGGGVCLKEEIGGCRLISSSIEEIRL